MFFNSYLSFFVMVFLSQRKIIDNVCTTNNYFIMKNENAEVKEKQQVSEAYPHFTDYMKTLVLRKMKAGKNRTADNYLSAVNKFSFFLKEKADSLTLDHLTPELLQDYLQWLIRTEELSEGTIDFYLRTLKAMYNQGVKEFHLQPPFGHPFAGTTIKVPPTRKRALPDEVFNRLMSLDLSDKPHLLTALHLALFIFYARGMSFIDVYNLTNDNLVDNYIIYIRSKTQVSLQVKITPEMKHLLKMYRRKHCPWIFPFLHEKMHGYGDVSPQSSLRRINRYLREVGDMLELQHPLTTYVMRHSWASLMLEAGSELGVISQSLGHTSMHTTEIYLSNLSVGKIDKAADDMLNAFIRKKKFYRKELLGELDEKNVVQENCTTKGTAGNPEGNQAAEAGKTSSSELSKKRGEKASRGQAVKPERGVSKVWTALVAVAAKIRGGKK